MAVILLHVDAFTKTPFAGNPAAICLFPPSPEKEWMQDLAAEMNLAETAFLEPHPEVGHFGLRWFTPLAEVPLCGHATLASAHALWEEGVLSRAETVTFHTKSGPLRASTSGDGITLDFPAIATTSCVMPDGFEKMLGARVTEFQQSPTKYLAEIESADALRSMKPDFARIAQLPREGVVATARSDDPRYDFLSRFFAPALGIPEDPVTGSSHCLLAAYWAERMGKQEFSARQVSRRGGDLQVRLSGDRVFLTGSAVTIFRTELLA